MDGKEDKAEKLEFRFYGPKAKEVREAFIGWYLDGGGDDGFHATCEIEGIVYDGMNYSGWETDPVDIPWISYDMEDE